ncbi:MAG: leucine-rich repeat protein, partial [Clostridiales bacterium]|nr:leucine-rich repeat protein [Clostridiales bacterium]
MTISSGVQYIDDYAFSYCTSLSTITIPDSVISIGWAAFEHSGLESVTIPDSITSISGYMFHGCKKLADVTLPDSVTSIGGGAFSLCYSLTSLDFLPDGVTEIGDSVFHGCAGLVDVTIPDRITSLGEGAFYGCENMVSVSIPSSVTTIGYGAFEECDSLASVTIPEGTTYIGEYAFYECNNLEYVSIPDSVTYIGENAFRNCPKLSLVDFSEEDSSASEASISVASEDGISVASEDGISVASDSVTRSIENDTFVNCTSLTAVVIPDSITTIDSYAFGYTYSSSKKTYTAISGFTIYGYTGTAAETYANQNGFTFIDLADSSTRNVLATPTLSGATNTSSGVKITWKEVTGALLYRVFRKTGSDGTWKKLADTFSTSYTDTAVTYGTTYYYTVRCISPTGAYISSYNSTGVNITYNLVTPSVTLSNASAGVTVKWSKVSGASGYYVYRKTSGGTFSKIATITSG